MPSLSEAVQIGPFIGGLNTFSDPSSIADNEMVICDNFELDLDGSLVSRPPLVAAANNFPLGATGNAQILDYYYGPGGVPYLIASDGLTNTYYWDGTSWTLITNTFAASAMAQYNGQAWLMAPVSSANPGGYWTPTGGFTAQPNMPKGECIVSMKQRLWVAIGRSATSNGTRLYYSKVLGDPLGTWIASPDFVDVGSGDGQNIVQLAVYFQTLLLFRTGSIMGFAFSADPATGVVSTIVPGVGLADKNCTVAYENSIYFLYEDRCYAFQNNRVQQLNQKVPFRSGTRTGIYEPYSVSKFDQRIIVSYWDKIYVFSMRTNTWTTWSSTLGSIGKFIQLDDASEAISAVAFPSTAVATGGTRSTKTLTLRNALDSSRVESMTCLVRTKIYNYQLGSGYKRLFWWGAEAIFRGTIQGTASPVAYTQNATWGQLLSGYTWGQLLAQTWGLLTSDTYEVQTSRTSTAAGSLRKFVKFLKALRFRQIYYTLQFTADGTPATSPVHLFLLMTYVRAGERVSKEIS